MHDFPNTCPDCGEQVAWPGTGNYSCGTSYGLRITADSKEFVKLDTVYNARCYKRQLEATQARLADLQSKYDAAEFWETWVYPKGATAKQVQNELTDYHMMLEQVTQVYSELTGGRISKPNTMAFEVIGQANELVEAAIKEYCEEETEELREDKQLLRDGLQQILRLTVQAGWANLVTKAIHNKAADLLTATAHVEEEVESP